MTGICHTISNEKAQSRVATSELLKEGNGSAKKSLIATGILLVLGTAFASPSMAFTETVTNNTVTNESLGAGDYQSVTIGGVTNNTTINSDGGQTVHSGGVSNTATINDNGSQTIANQGTSNGTIINDGGWQTIIAGGTSHDTVINTGGDQVVIGGGTANGTAIHGGMQTVHGTANDTVVYKDGEQYINQGGVANGSIVDGGMQNVFEGTANNTTIDNDGAQVIYYGTANNTTINAGQQTINDTAIANDTTINNDGWQWVLDGGTANNATINTGGNQVILGGAANSTIIHGGMQTVHGTANDTVVYKDGEQYINQGGVANGTVVDGGLQTVFEGTANNTIIDNDGVQSIYYGTANNTTINAGQQSINSTGIANDTTINKGGWQWIHSGGTANNTAINAGGFQILFDGATSNASIINADGNQTVHAGAVANNTTVNAGGMQYVDIGGTANDTIVNGGYQMVFSTANNTVANAGEIYAGADSVFTGVTQINGSAILDGELVTNNGTLRFNPGSTNTVTVDITGSGELDKTGSGTLILNNTNTYTGGTTVSGGKLIVGGTTADSSASIAGDVDVLNGATLGGHGQIGGTVTVQNGGKVNPGNSVGTLTVGDAHFMSGSTFEARVNADGTNDKLMASNGLGIGTVQIDNGAQLAITGGAGRWNDSTTYTLIDTDAGVTGTFTEVNSNLAFLTSAVDYSNPNQVNLTMSRNGVGFGDVGTSHNEKSTGKGIESSGSNNSVYQEIIGMTTAQANNAYNNLSGEIHGSVKSALIENSRYPRHSVLEHLEGTSTQTGNNLWINTWAHNGHLKSNGNAARLDNQGAGLIIGADLYQSKNGITTLGAAVGYEENDLKARNLRSSDAGTKSVHLLGYGKTELGPVDLKAGAGYSKARVDTKRNVNVGSISSQNKAKYNANLVQLFTEGSHDIDINEKTRVTPYAGMLYQNVRTDSFKEKGVAAQLQGRSGSNHSTSSTLGVRGEWKISPTSKLHTNLGWQHSFGERAPDSKLKFTGGKTYNIKGVQTNRNNALVGVGVNAELRPNLTLNTAYDGQFGSRSVDHGVKVGLNLKF